MIFSDVTHYQQFNPSENSSEAALLSLAQHPKSARLCSMRRCPMMQSWSWLCAPVQSMWLAMVVAHQDLWMGLQLKFENRVTSKTQWNKSYMLVSQLWQSWCISILTSHLLLRHFSIQYFSNVKTIPFFWGQNFRGPIWVVLSSQLFHRMPARSGSRFWAVGWKRSEVYSLLFLYFICLVFWMIFILLGVNWFTQF